MTAEQFEKLIRCKVDIIVPRRLLRVTAEARVSRSMLLDLIPHRTPKARSAAFLCVNDQLRELLMRDVYEDQRRLLFVALAALLAVHPMDRVALDQARRQVIDILRRQPSDLVAVIIDRYLEKESC